jgi:1,4-alpha-glucan branching enzyme
VVTKGPIEGGKREVTFVLPNEAAGTTVHLCGEFNDWSITSTPMFLAGDGSFRVTLLLEVGRKFRYRYLVDGERWENDWEADEYLPNEFSGEDSAVNV